MRWPSDGDPIERGGGRWLRLRRHAIGEAALRHLQEHPDDEYARAELEDPAVGWMVPRDVLWHEVRQRAIEVCALATLADKYADDEDRWTTTSARRALEDPAADWAEDAMYGAGAIARMGTTERKLIVDALTDEREQ